MNNKAKLLALASIFVVAAAAQATDYMDQIGSNPADWSGNVAASQIFEASFAQYNIVTLDNFTISGGAVNINQIQAGMGMWNFTGQTWANAGDFDVNIYSTTAAATGNLTGDVFHGVVAHASATIDSSYFSSQAQTNLPVLVTLPVSFSLNPGTYFIGVMANNTFATNGQCGVMTTTTFAGNPGGLDASQANPGGGFALGGGANWAAISPASDAMYRISGSPVPEPASMAVLGIGALALLRRRNKKA